MNSKMVKLGLSGGVALGGVLTIFSCFLEYVSALGGLATTSLIKGGDGYFFLVLAIASIILTFLNSEKFDRVALVTTAAMMGLAVFEISDTSDKLGGYGNLIDYGAGYYLMIAGSIIALLAAVAKFIYVKKFDTSN